MQYILTVLMGLTITAVNNYDRWDFAINKDNYQVVIVDIEGNKYYCPKDYLSFEQGFVVSQDGKTVRRTNLCLP